MIEIKETHGYSVNGVFFENKEDAKRYQARENIKDLIGGDKYAIFKRRVLEWINERENVKFILQQIILELEDYLNE